MRLEEATPGTRVVHDVHGAGTVIKHSVGTVGVRFDNPKFYFHDLYGSCPDGTGYYCAPEFLRPLKEARTFKVGDRVRAIGEVDGLDMGGDEGTVRVVKKSGLFGGIGVEFDHEFSRGHDLHPTLHWSSKRGRWAKPEELVLLPALKEEEPEVTNTKKENTNMSTIMKVETLKYINGMEVSTITVDRQIELIAATEARIKYLEGIETKTTAISAEIKKLKSNLEGAVRMFNE